MVRLNQEQKEKIRSNILEVSQKHFFEDGYDQTSTKHIAKEVGIAEGTIFNYFDSKAELFLESFAHGYVIEGYPQVNINLEIGVFEVIYEFLYKNLKTFISIPKMLSKEVVLACFNVAKRNPGLLKKLADLDYKVMDELEDLLQILIDKKLMKNCNVKVVSESIYSVIMFEFFLYLYENEVSKEMMLEKIKEKFHFLLDAYINK